MMTDVDKAYQYIFDQIVPNAIESFRDKARDYRGGPAFLNLGAKGQFSDINRKFWKLYHAIWEDGRLEGEQPYEIVEDMIGHCFLLLYCLRKPTFVQTLEELGSSEEVLKAARGPMAPNDSEWGLQQ
jgi:hypothetical protein